MIQEGREERERKGMDVKRRKREEMNEKVKYDKLRGKIKDRNCERMARKEETKGEI